MVQLWTYHEKQLKKSYEQDLKTLCTPAKWYVCLQYLHIMSVTEIAGAVSSSYEKECMHEWKPHIDLQTKGLSFLKSHFHLGSFADTLQISDCLKVKFGLSRKYKSTLL